MGMFTEPFMITIRCLGSRRVELIAYYINQVVGHVDEVTSCRAREVSSGIVRAGRGVGGTNVSRGLRPGAKSPGHC